MKLLKQTLLIILIFSYWNTSAQSFNGYALYNEQNSNTAYLIDKDGNIAHSWSCQNSCNYSVKLKENGNIVRGAVYNSNQLSGAAIGGMIQELDPNANIVWEFIYSSASYCSHHDFCVLPNGNVLLVAWEVKAASELTAAGMQNASADKWPTHIVEVQQNGTGGQIVWEWHMWDHMIQDYDATKSNYGVVADHPELMDINAVSGMPSGGPGGGPGGGGSSGGDWFHVNGIDYNADLDQIVFSSRTSSEFFIIDHSTTTSEAASHSGGNSGKGGDFLYRWGKPANYGNSGTQTIPAAVHDPRWITNDGRLRGGYIEFFNNAGNNGSSTVDAILPPTSGYNYLLSAGQAYAPTNYEFRHNCLASSTGQSAHNTLSNGNLFVNVSNQYMYEVDQNNNVIWQYNAGPTKAFRYECDYPGITALLGANPCGTLKTSDFSLSKIQITPNPGQNIFKISGLSNLPVSYTITDFSGRKIKQGTNSEFDMSEVPNGIYFLVINQDDQQAIHKIVVAH